MGYFNRLFSLRNGVRVIAVISILVIAYSLRDAHTKLKDYFYFCIGRVTTPSIVKYALRVTADLLGTIAKGIDLYMNATLFKTAFGTNLKQLNDWFLATPLMVSSTSLSYVGKYLMSEEVKMPLIHEGCIVVVRGLIFIFSYYFITEFRNQLENEEKKKRIRAKRKLNTGSYFSAQQRH